MAHPPTLAHRRGLVVTISEATVWRWLNEDALRPWQHRCWVFPRDPDFADQGAHLYHGHWDRRCLKEDDLVLLVDEKARIQARAGLSTIEVGVHPSAR